MKWIVPVALGIGAYLLFFRRPQQPFGDGIAYYQVPPGLSMQLPQGGVVPETQLPSLGFVRVQGLWYHQTQMSGAAQFGVNPNSPQWLNIILGIVQAGGNAYQNLVSQGIIPTGGGLPAGGGPLPAGGGSGELPGGGGGGLAGFVNPKPVKARYTKAAYQNMDAKEGILHLF